MPEPVHRRGRSPGSVEGSRAELAERLGIDVAGLTDADAEWFANELHWIERARVLLDAALAEAPDFAWSLAPDPRVRGT
jgi:hypothetical protein